MNTRRVVQFLASIGIILGSISSYVSHLSQTAALPSFLYGDPARRFASFKSLLGIPIEFYSLLWFAFLLIVLRPPCSANRSMQRLLVWTGTLATGVALGVCYMVGLGSWLVLVLSSIVAMLWIWSFIWTRAVPISSPRELLTESKIDWQGMVSSHGTLWLLTATIVGFVVIGEYFALTAGLTKSDARDAQLVKWYVSKPRLAIDDLTSPRAIRVVVFSDYQCPFCSILVPQFQAISERYHGTGRATVEFVKKDFPLNPDCNSGVHVRMHPAACDAAVAIHFLGRVKGEHEAEVLSAKLYSKHGRIDAKDIETHLASLNLLDQFRHDYSTDRLGVLADARLGERLGISSTPTAFIDGRLMRNLTPQTLEVILDYHTGGDQSAAKTALR